MRGKLIYIAMIAVIAGIWIARAVTPAAVILDVAAIIGSTDVPGRPMTERQEGSLYWASIHRSAFSSLDIASLSSHGPIEIVTGSFTEPVKGRSRVMQMLGTKDAIPVVQRSPRVVLHRGGQFAELRLFRDEKGRYTGFWACTSAGLGALE